MIAKQAWKNRIGWVFIFVLGSYAVSSLAAEVEQARKILDVTGVQGGLVVHLGCGAGKLSAALRVSDHYLVQGLDTDRGNIQTARHYIQSQGLYGDVTAISFNGSTLPYNDNLVNLLVVQASEALPMSEMMRVLTPNGVLCLQEGDKYLIRKKAMSSQTDEWTHYLHGPNNNAVSQDKVVSHPYHIQWVGLPTWTRNHNHLNSYSALVTANGRIFYILDEGPTQSVSYAPQWSLVARDAYNGVVLWKKPIRDWEAHLRPFRSGPTELPRRLVAVGDRVYVTLGYGKPLSILNAATGQLIQEVPETEGTAEIICFDNTLYLVAGDTHEGTPGKNASGIGTLTLFLQSKRILAVQAETGQVLWSKHDEDTHELLPTTLCVNHTGLYFHSPDHLIRLDRDSGDVQWRTKRVLEKNRLAWSAPTLVLYKDLVMCAEGKHGGGTKKKNGNKTAPIEKPQSSGMSDVQWTITASPRSSEGGELIVYRASDGEALWRTPAAFGYSSPPNLFVANDLVWVSTDPGINHADMGEGRDPYTGEIKQKIDMEFAFDAAHHHRCYRDKATEDFLLLGRTGVEFVNIKDKNVQRHYWIRGTCQYGVMPANGLLYMPGHSCGCYIQSKLNGFWTLAPQLYDDTVNDSGRLLKGPAYGKVTSTTSSKPTDWPMFRYDVERTCTTPAVLAAKPKLSWRVKLDDQNQLTPPVIAGNKLLTVRKDRQEVVCLHTKTGEILWRFVCGGRIDSPPTLYQGMALVGAHDGYVYCLDLADGKMVWSFRAAPQGRQTVAYGQVASVWPVVGSVLIHQGKLYCTAGRTSYLDGGMTLFILDPLTGREISRTPFYSRDPQTGEQPDELLEDVELPGTLPDILTVKNDTIFLRDKKLDLLGRETSPGEYEEHLYSSAGLLNDEWWHRTIWIWGKRAFGRASGWALAGRYNPSGRFLALDGQSVYGYQFNENRKDGHVLFHASKKVKKVDKQLKNNNAAVVKYVTPDIPIYHWRQTLEMAVRTMLLTQDNVFAAGPIADETILFDTVDTEARLSVFDREEGKQISSTQLPAQPVFGGMAAAGQQIFVAFVNGEIACYE